MDKNLAQFVEDHDGIWYGLDALISDSGLTIDEVSRRSGIPIGEIGGLLRGDVIEELFKEIDVITKVCGGIGLRVEVLKRDRTGIKYYVIY